MSDQRLDDLIYHGVDKRIFVEPFISGWTGRDKAERIRELAPIDPVVTFNWGYIGSGSNQVAQAILGDALDAKDVPQFLYQAFTADLVSQFGSEFRIRQGAVLRWLRGFLCAEGRHDFPAPLPPVDPYDDGYRLPQ